MLAILKANFRVHHIVFPCVFAISESRAPIEFHKWGGIVRGSGGIHCQPVYRQREKHNFIELCTSLDIPEMLCIALRGERASSIGVLVLVVVVVVVIIIYWKSTPARISIVFVCVPL